MRYLIIAVIAILSIGPAHAATSQLEDTVLVGRSISSTAQRARLRLHDGDTASSREYIDITAPTDITTSYEVKLPPAEPAVGEVLIVTGVSSHVATTDWDSPGAGSGITELTGDVTAGPGTGSQAATIAADAVTFAKMPNIATDSLIGRDTAGTGDPENLTLGTGLTISGGALNATTDAPVNATYITQTANATLTNEQALASLSTGYVKVTTGTGVLTSQAVPIPVADGGTGDTWFANGLILYGGSNSTDPVATDAGLSFIAGIDSLLKIGKSGVGGKLSIRGSTSGNAAIKAAPSAGADIITTLPTVVATLPTSQATTQNKYLISDTSGNWSFSSLGMGQTEVDWGDNSTNEDVMSFTVTDATITSGQRITAQVAYEAPTGRDVDELDGQPLTCMCVAGSGQFTLVMQSLNGPFNGKVKVNYTVGN